MDSARLWQVMKDGDAVWEHPKDYPKAPHVVLRSDYHSDGFVDTLRFLSGVLDLSIVAEMLAKKLKRKRRIKIDWVVGSPMAGIPFATAMAPFLGAKRIGFNEKAPGSDKELICRFDIEPGDNFLMIEEMTTTGATPQRGIEAVLEKNPKAMPLDVVGAFLIRCDPHPPELLHGRELVSLISLPELGVNYHEWEEGKCPLCDAGSRPIRNCKQVWKALLHTMKDPTSPVINP